MNYGPCLTVALIAGITLAGMGRAAGIYTCRDKDGVVHFSNVPCRSSPPPSNEKIEGAFGLLLGKSFNPADAMGMAETESGAILYRFKPKSPLRSFTEYYVAVTPKGKQIYSIRARGEMRNNEVCKKEQVVVVELLKKKYGPPEKRGLADELSDSDTIRQGNRGIVVKCTGLFSVTIDIGYIDSVLAQQAERERIELEVKKVDSSGL